MKIHAGTDGRVYFQTDDGVSFSTSAGEALAALNALSRAWAEADYFARRRLDEEAKPRPMPREVTRERLP